MKRIIATSALLTGLLACGAPTLRAQVTNALNIYHAIELEYQTETGKSYMLQGSLDLLHWTDIGTPVLGNGQMVDQLFSTKNADTVQYASYRLQILPGPTNGYAPWSVDGVQVQMDDGSATNIVSYLSSTNGQDIYAAGNDPFTYQFARTGENDSRADRTYSPTRRDTVSYTYTGPGAGSWVREDYEQGVLKGRVVGSFRYLGYVTNSVGTNLPPTIVPAQPPLPPNALTGLVYYVFTGSAPEKYQFNNTGNSGLATPATTSNEGESAPGGNIFTYTYSVLSSNTASLTINFGYYGIGGDRQEYDLSFNDGASGLFNRRIYRLGSLFTTDHGVFSPNAVLTPPAGTNNPTGGTNVPPASPVSYTYTMNVDTVPPRLVFSSTDKGTEFDDSAPSEFSYTYVATGPNTFQLVAKFKQDKYDEYDLTFSTGTSGTVVRQQFKNGYLNRTQAGTFTVAPTN